MKRILCLTLALAVMLCSVSVVFADTAEQNRILLPTQEGHYLGGSYDKVYGIYAKPSYSATRMVTSYSVQPQHILLDFDLGEICGKDIRKVSLLVSTLKGFVKTFPAEKTLALHEITESWTNNSAPLPAYSEQPVAQGVFTYNTPGTDEKVTGQGYRSLLNDGYPSSANNNSGNTELIDTGATNYDHAIDITDFVKEKSNAGNPKFSLLVKGVATELQFRYISVLVTYTNNTPPAISLKNVQSRYEAGADAVFSASVTGSNDISKAELYFDGEKAADGVLSDGLYTANIPGEKMTAGTHTLKWHAEDANGTTAEKAFEIHVKGGLPEQYLILNAALTGCYVENKSPNDSPRKEENIVDTIYAFNTKPYGYGLQLYYKNEKILLKYDLSDIISKDIVKAEVLLACKDSPVFTGSKAVNLYEITGTWNNNGYKGLPPYNTEPLFSGNLTFTAPTAGETKTKFGYKSLVNNSAYPTTGNNVDFGNNGATNFDQAIDVTSLVKKNMSAVKGNLEVMLEDGGSGCRYGFGAIRLLVTYRDNTIPSVSFDNIKPEYAAGEDIVLSAAASDDDGIASVCFEIDGKSYTAALSDGKYTVTLPSGTVSKGKHTVKCVAIDENDAENYVTAEIIVGRPAVNQIPVIDAQIPDNGAVSSDTYVPFKVYDPDWDEITEISAKLDGAELTVNKNGYNYYVTVPAASMTEGGHSLVIKATDLWGGTAERTYTVTASGKPRKYASISNTQQGNYINKYNGIYAMSEKPEEVYNKWNYVMQNGAQEYIQRYDLTSVKDFDIEKVELLTARGGYNNVRTLQVFEVTGDWSVTNTKDSGKPACADEPFVSKGLEINPTDDPLSLVKLGYPESMVKNFDGTVDITDFVLKKLAEGKTSVDMLYKCPLSSIYTSGIKMLVTYRDNTVPTITIGDLSGLAEGKDFAVSVSAEDSDGIAEQSVYFDGRKLTDGKIPGEYVKGSTHVITVNAVDKFGATSTASKSVIVPAHIELKPEEFTKNYITFDTSCLKGRELVSAELSDGTAVNNIEIGKKIKISAENPTADMRLKVKYKDIADTVNKDITVNASEIGDMERFGINPSVYHYVTAVFENGTNSVEITAAGETFTLSGENFAAADISVLGDVTLKNMKLNGNVKYFVFTTDFARGVRADKIAFTKLKNGAVKGSTAEFAAEIEKTGYFNDSITWSVTGASNSAIDQNGVLTVSAAETADYITVKAKADIFPYPETSVRVKITEAPQSTFGSAAVNVGVLSDIHLYSYARADVFKAAVNKLKEEAGGKLDVLLIPGDITQNFAKPYDSTTEQAIYDQVKLFKTSVEAVTDSDTQIVYCLGNHDSDGNGLTKANPTKASMYSKPGEFFVKVLSGWDGTASTYDSVDTTTENPDYNRYFGRDLDFSQIEKGNRITKVKGYYFIAFEPNSYGSEYTDDTISWLEQKLEIAAAADPNKPIFLITHPKVYGTVMSSDTENYSANITELLNKYPQVVLYTGHTHNPLNTEYAIMQTGFTSVEGSSTQYLDCIPGKFASGLNNRENGQLLQLDENSNIKITRYDFTGNSQIGNPWYINGTNVSGSHLFAYDGSRFLNAGAPYFEGASVTLNGNTLTFSAAKGDSKILYYNVTAKNKTTGEKVTAAVSSLYFTPDMPESYSWTFDSITDPENYSYSVTAVDEWGKASLPVVLNDKREGGITLVLNAHDGNNCSFTATAVNKSGEDISGAQAILAFFDKNDNSLINVDVFKNINIADGYSKDFEVSLDSNISDFNAKFFIWNNLIDVKPVLASGKVSVN